MIIVNGAYGEDKASGGRPTSFHQNSKTVIDLAIVDKGSADRIKNFAVKDQHKASSDHATIQLTIACMITLDAEGRKKKVKKNKKKPKRRKATTATNEGEIMLQKIRQ